MTQFLPVPLFHGTSTIFLDSIRRAGLGGHDPVASLRGLECLWELRSLGATHLEGSDWWLLHRDIIDGMTAQTASGGGFNWRHGAAYLTPSELTAVRYALSNSCGSELFSMCFELYAQLKERSVNEMARIDAGFPELGTLWAASAKRALLVRVEQVPAEAVRSEFGEPADATIELINSSLAKSLACNLQQLNFQLVRPLAAHQLTFSLISETGGF